MAKDFRASQIQTTQIISSGSSGTNAKIVFYPIEKQSSASPNQGIIDPIKFGTGSIGVDTFIFVSGGIGEKDTANNSITVFGGDVHISGNLTSDQQIFSSGSDGTLAFRLGIVDFARTTSTSSNPLVAGQIIFPANEFSGSLTFRTVLNSTDAATTASVRLFNVASGTYVELAPGQSALETTNLAPTVVESQDLFGAINFNTSSQTIYEVHLHTSDGSNEVLVGGAEFRPSGSFTGQTIISQSNTYISGTWIDNNNRLRTTASVAINGDGNFADGFGDNVYFYVSGTVNTWTTSSIGKKSISVFGGDVRISGSFIGGSGSNILEPFSTAGSIAPFNVIAGGTNHTITSYSSFQFLDGIVARNFIGAGNNNGITQSIDSSIVGGTNNKLEGFSTLSGAFIGGGNKNFVAGNDAVQVGGHLNTMQADRAFGGAGYNNYADASDSAIVAGQSNSTSGESSVIIGGQQNSTYLDAVNSFIGAGKSNTVEGAEAGLVAGNQNTIGLGATNSFIGAGKSNLVDGKSSAIVVGYNNSINFDSHQSFVGAGQDNRISSFVEGRWQGIVVGSGNLIQASTQNATDYSIILGGQSNLINDNKSLLFGFDLTSSVGDGNTIQFGSRIANKNPFRFIVSASKGAVFHGGLSGSLTRIENGSPYLLAGSNITIVTNSFGQIEISSSAGGGGGTVSLQDAYNNGSAIEPSGEAVTISGSGVGSGTALLELIPEDVDYTALQVRSTGTTGQPLILLHGNSSEFGGGGVKLLSSQGQISSISWQSSSLGFANTDLASIKFDDQRRLLVFESFEDPSNVGTQVTSSIEIRANRVLITGSAVTSGVFAAKGGLIVDSTTTLTPSLNSYGEDVYFYVSGTFGSGSAGDAVAVFGGDVRISGTLAVGTGSVYIDDNTISFTSSSIKNEGGKLVFYDKNNPSGQSLQQLVSGSTSGSASSYFFSNTTNNIQTTGSFEASGSGLFKSGLTGALNVLPDGSPFLFAGENIILSTASNGQVTIEATTASIGAGGTNNEVQYNLSGVLTGSSNFWIDDGASVNITGSVVASAGFSGSLTTLSDGSPYLLAGDNITIITNSLGQVVISSSAASPSGSGGSALTSGSLLAFSIADYASTNATSSAPQAVGQLSFNSTEYTGPIHLRLILSTTDSTTTASVRLFNVSSGSFVHIGGPNVTTLETTSSMPVLLESVDLRNATNFGNAQSIYELQGAISTGSQLAFIGGAEFRVTGAVTAPPTRLNLGSYTIITATSSNPQAVGGGYFVPSEHNTNSCVFRAIVATTTSSNSAVVQLYNITSGAFVEIGGPGITELSSTASSPTNIESVNLLSATNFDPTFAAVYEVRVYGSGSTSPITTFVNSEMVCN